MGQFRIVENHGVYRIQEEHRFLWFREWVFQPDVFGFMDYSTYQDALRHLRLLESYEKRKRSPWKVVDHDND